MSLSVDFFYLKNIYKHLPNILNRFRIVFIFRCVFILIIVWFIIRKLDYMNVTTFAKTVMFSTLVWIFLISTCTHFILKLDYNVPISKNFDYWLNSGSTNVRRISQSTVRWYVNDSHRTAVSLFTIYIVPILTFIRFSSSSFAATITVTIDKRIDLHSRNTWK